MRKVLYAAVIVLLVALAAGYYLYRKPHRNVSGLKAAFTFTADSLLDQYKRDEAAADRIYLNKIIEIKGKISAIARSDSSVNIQLDAGVPDAAINCSMAKDILDEVQNWQKDTVVIIKGRCSGFLADVNMVDCVPVK